MTPELIAFWLLFAVLAIDDARTTKILDTKHGVVLGTLMTFAALGFLLQPITSLIGLGTGYVLYKMGAMYKADIALFMGAGGVGRFVGIAPTLILLGVAVFVVALLAFRVKGHPPITPHLFALSVITYAGVML